MRHFTSTFMPALTAALAACLLFAAAALAQDARVGVVDIDKAVEASKPGQAAKKKVEEKRESLEKTLQKKRDDLEKKVADFRNQAEAMNEDARAKRVRELEQERVSLMEQAKKSDDEFQKTMRDNLEPLYTKARNSAVDIGKKRGFSLVLHVVAAQILLADNVDITSDVTKALDQK
ncbi:MAG: OmpH family outer membrane protein [Deltaproteobacteria bacterium]|nr:OmpH family outer membrane protein [Deltaproteobacteria bacterium]